MSQFCPYCGQGFKRLASHEWRCKQKPVANSNRDRVQIFDRICGISETSQNVYATARYAHPVSQPQKEIKQRCPDCGGAYKNLANHKICHKRGSGKFADMSYNVEMEVCPDCRKSFKNLVNHRKCPGRRSRKQEEPFMSSSSYDWQKPPPTPQSYHTRPHPLSSFELPEEPDTRRRPGYRSYSSAFQTPPPTPQPYHTGPPSPSPYEPLVELDTRQGRPGYPLYSSAFQSPPPTSQSYHTGPPSPSPYELDTRQGRPGYPSYSSAFQYPPSTPRLHQPRDTDAEGNGYVAGSRTLYQPPQHTHRRRRRTSAFEHNADLDDEEALLIALAASVEQEGTTRRGNESPVSEDDSSVIKAHLDYCIDTGSVRSIDVDREKVWTNSFDFYKDIKVSDTDQSLMVIFKDSGGTREEGVDQGGPRREFLRLMCEAIVRDSGMLHGNKELGLLLRPSVSQYRKKHFKVLGVMLATIIAQNGQPPAIFATPVVDAILEDDSVTSPSYIPLKYVPEPAIRLSLQKVSDAKSAGELEEALENCEWRYDLDGPARVTMDNREEFFNICVHYYVILKSRPMLDQMMDGLKHCGILSLIRDHNLRHILEYDSNMTVTSEKVMNLLVPRYTTRREEEVQIVKNIRKFLESVENGCLFDDLRDNRLTRAQTKFAKSRKPENLLQFVTGCDREPVGGFSPPPAIVFTHSDTWRLPHVSTCSNELYVTVHDEAKRWSSLAMALLTAMMNTETFTTA